MVVKTDGLFAALNTLLYLPAPISFSIPTIMTALEEARLDSSMITGNSSMSNKSRHKCQPNYLNMVLSDIRLLPSLSSTDKPF